MEEIIGLVYRFGANDYQLSLTRFEPSDQELLLEIFTKYCDKDAFSCARGGKKLTIDDANIDYWEK